MRPILVILVAALVGAVFYFFGRRRRRVLEESVSRLSAELAAAKAARVPPPPSPNPRPELYGQLANTLSLRSSEDQVLWSAFGTFWAANAILLVALFSTGKLPESPVVAPTVSAVGFGISLVWHFIQRRALGHIERYEALAERLEQRLDVEDSLSTSARRNDADYVRFLKGGPRARSLMKWCSGGTAFIWLLALFVFAKL